MKHMEKTCVEIVTNIKNCDRTHENPYFGQHDGGTWKPSKLDQGNGIFKIKLVFY